METPSKKVLVVEDDILISNGIKSYLEESEVQESDIVVINHIDLLKAEISNILGGVYGVVLLGGKIYGGHTNEIIIELLGEDVNTPLVNTSGGKEKDFGIPRMNKPFLPKHIYNLIEKMNTGQLQQEWDSQRDIRRNLLEAFTTPKPEEEKKPLESTQIPKKGLWDRWFGGGRK